MHESDLNTDLILWRHADAEDGTPDSSRQLTKRGRKQAARMARWLDQQLPAHYRVLSSPAARALQTAEALRSTVKTDKRLAVGASAADVLKVCGWPNQGGATLVVGHQPTLGRVAALLISGREHDWTLRKGSICWLSRRPRSGDTGVVLRAVIQPEMIP